MITYNERYDVLLLVVKSSSECPNLCFNCYIYENHLNCNGKCPKWSHELGADRNTIYKKLEVKL